ncbi:MAG: hydroxymethylglutaryl-CoA lyase [Xanthomonadales bacterium]|nr:hydroxymethylglutaryl-CoA lyase [Xanthomonadales bacterium]
MEDFVTIVEVGPRDGLQNEPKTLSAALRIELIDRLANCGVPVVEAGSFVSPKWVPQMAGTAEVLAGISTLPETRYPVLVPNMQGFESAVQAGATEISVFAAASESFSQRNTNCSIKESITRLKPVAEAARLNNIRVRGYVSCVLGCPYEGEIDTARVVSVSEQLLQIGCEEISLGDTIGTGTAAKASALINAVTSVAPVEQLAVHFHDTYGQALANILACLDAGVRIIDSSVSGLGGCPYAHGASGNVASEDVVYMLHGLGLETGIDLAELAMTGDWISKQLQRPNHSKAGTALNNRIQDS